MAETTNVKVVPGRANSFATALRGYLNVVLASSRIGDLDSMERAISDMHHVMTSLEREVRLNVEA